MVSIVEHLKNSIHEAFSELGVVVKEIHLEHPELAEHGDYSTNVALRIASEAGKKPREVAEALAEILRENKNEMIGKIEVAGPGFINFTLSRNFFISTITEILEKGGEYGKSDALIGRNVLIEYTDPNPFKEFHIGHLMSNAIGESLSRLIEFSGADVKRANYQGDIGLHVAKAIYGMRLEEKNFPAPDAPTGEKAWFLGKAYAAGSIVPEADKENYEKGLQELNKKIYERTNVEVNRLYDWGREVSLAYFESIYKMLGTHFDYYFFESESGPFGKQTVEENTPKVFQESDGAVVFHGEEHGLHTRVFVTSEGLPTYEAKELGLAKLKYKKYPYDLSFVITGSEVRDYFKVVRKAMEMVFPDLAQKTIHIPHGMLRLPSGKMSSRTGDVITAEWLIEEAKKRIKEKMADANVPDKEMVAEEVAVGAIKYSILKNAPGNDIIFDFDTSLSFEGSSGPYLQYTHARASSVLLRAKEEGLSASLKNPPEEAGELERILYQFPEIVLRAREENAPQFIATYITGLAQAFNNFYAEERIVDAGEETPYRLALTEAVAMTLKNGLWLLGIKAPERM